MVVSERPWTVVHLDDGGRVTSSGGADRDRFPVGTEFAALVDPDDVGTVLDAIHAARNASPSQVHHRIRGDRWVASTITTVGDVTAIVMHDLTGDLLGPNDPRASSDRRARAVIDALDVACAEVTAAGRVLHANDAWATLTGQADHLLAIVPGRTDLQELTMRRGQHVELDGFALDSGAELTVRLVLTDDGHVLATADTRLRARRSMTASESSGRAPNGLDEVTGLLTRTGLIAGWEAFEGDLPIAVIVMDLAGFRAVNEQHGWAIGDIVLRSVAQRFRLATRPGDLLARLGGDEFALVCRDVDDPFDLISIAGRLRDALEADVEFDDPKWGPCLWPIAASVGAVLGEVSDGLSELLRQADNSMQHDQAQRRAEIDADVDADGDADAEPSNGATPTVRSTIDLEPDTPMASVHRLTRPRNEPTWVAAGSDQSPGDDHRPDPA